jgi:hypothetical protein
MKKLVLAFTLAIGAFAVGCTPSPEKVCAHVIDIVSKEMKGEMKMSDDDKKKAQDDCVKKGQEQKEKEPDAWKCESKCAMDATNFEGMMKCEDTCGTKKKKGEGKSDKGDDDSKKKKGDDDKKKDDK